MRTAYQTIIWGPFIDDIEYVLKVVSGAGYEGIEFAQRPEELGDPAHLGDLLAKYGLTLLGLAGGSLWDRIQFCRQNSLRPEYLYVETWSEFMSSDMARVFKFALHPHVYKKVHRLTDAMECLRKHAALTWIPDTAHLAVAGDDPLKALDADPKLLAAVHLKDWKPEYGRSSHRYARGFTEYGNGIIDLGAVIRKLQNVSPDCWLVAEQDQTSTDPATSAYACAEWLANHGVPITTRNPIEEVGRVQLRNPWERLSGYLDEKQNAFLRSTMIASTLDIHECHELIASAFADLIPCHAVTVWAYNPRDDAASLLAVHPKHFELKPHLKVTDKLTEIAIERQTVTDFDLRDPQPGARYGYPDAKFALPELFAELPLTHMVAIPLLNPYNANHVRATVALFPRNSDLVLSPDMLRNLSCLGMIAARAIDAALDEICLHAAGSTNYLAGHSRLAKDFNDQLVESIRKVIKAKGCTLFVVDQSGERLEKEASTGFAWDESKAPLGKQYYKRGEGLTGRVWERNEGLLTANASEEEGWVGKSRELVEGGQHACMFVPWVDSSGQVVAVVRCQNKETEALGNMFSHNDTAVLDAIGQVAVPHLRVLLSEERRARSIVRLTHELRDPPVTIRGACQCAMKELEGLKLFTYDYLGDIWAWTELMRRLLANAQFYGLKSTPVAVRPKKTFLHKDVVAPSVRQIAVLVRGEGLPTQRIHYGGFEEMPPLWIDTGEFFQVLFNLLRNAIKYVKSADSFRVEVNGTETHAGYNIVFQDWGVGIEPGYSEAIFAEGVRVPGAETKHVEGQGLGLWVVRQIVHAHGGRVQLTHSSEPTEFTITLPFGLARSTPVSLVDVWRGAVERCRPLLQTRRFNENYISQDGIATIPFLWVDENAFRDVFVRLLDNCVKFAHQDPTAFNARIVAEQSEAGFTVRIQDSGVGIDPRYAEDVFLEGIRRPRPADPPLFGGKGVGLTIARQIIERHGGSICLGSCQQPTEFLIRLPANLGGPPLAAGSGEESVK